jgi:hypothetical protein
LFYALRSSLEVKYINISKSASCGRQYFDTLLKLIY